MNLQVLPEAIIIVEPSLHFSIWNLKNFFKRIFKKELKVSNEKDVNISIDFGKT